MYYMIEFFIGIAGGIAVGGAFAAIFTVLDIIPRLAQITRSTAHITKYEAAIALGAFSWTIIDFFSINMLTGTLGNVIFGLFAGAFVGLLAAGLTEVFNVLPIMAKRLKMTNYMYYFVMALILGKVSGSIFYWLIYVNIN